MKTFLKFLIGIAMLPVCYGYSVEFLKVVSGIYRNPGNYWGLFLGGGATYLLIHIVLPSPLLIHVFGHELTHAFFAKLFGWKVKSIKASGNGGHVKLSGSNFIVTLAPYFFTLYSFILLFVYILTVLANYDEVFYPYFIFLAGFTLSLHILMTIESLKTSQADIKEGGIVFSLPFIYIGNLIFITLILKLTVFNDISFLGYLKKGLVMSW
ncbi:MAG: hypothetical protein AAB275_08180, partial [Deltaproteobacteria bacterium]